MPIINSGPQANAQWDFWAGEVLDLTVEWADRMLSTARSTAVYGPSATGASGSGWSAVGHTASAFDFYVPPGFSALVSATAQHWSAYPTGTANGGVVTSSALTGVQSTVRLSATGAPGSYPISARLRTSSGQEFRHVFTARIQG